MKKVNPNTAYKRNGKTIWVEQKNVGRGHQYLVHDHEDMLDSNQKPIKMPSVTGVVGATDGSATEPIKRWALKHAIEYAKLEADEDVLYSAEQALNNAKKWPDSVLKMAGDRGTRIHNAIETFLHPNSTASQWKSKLDSNIDDIDKLETCFLKIEAWINESELKVVATEPLVYHKELQVGGAVDLMLSDEKSKIYICDFKTGSQVYKKDALQVTGYISCLISMLEDNVELWDRYNLTMPHGDDLENLQVGGAIFHIKEEEAEVDLKHIHVTNGAIFASAAFLHAYQKQNVFHEMAL